jgi:RNA polymerase sigma-70 factor (ECF subfamily)
MTKPGDETERTIREHFDAGQFEAAASLTLRAYGAEILAFLTARLKGRTHGEETLSMFAEDLWTGLPKFGWRCSMRTWAYALARNAAYRYATAPAQRAGRQIVLDCPEAMAAQIAEVRSTTRIYQRTAVKDRFRALREELDPDDQMLLVLRVDRDLSWRDLAMTMTGNVDLDDDALERESARLRKAFERVKQQLKRLAEREGLLASKD